MAIYRGVGGSGDATTDASSQATIATLKAAEAAASAIASASSAADAATAETGAETSETNAATSASNASTSASTATTKATSATSSESTATTKASEASTSASTATTKASEASTSASAAATSATASATSATASASSATASAASAAAAAATKDSIDEFYLGAQSSNPTVDNNGDAVTAGDWYFNTSSNETRIYNGSAWQVTAITTAGLLTATNNLSDIASATTSRTNLGLGTISTQNSNAVAITGGAIETTGALNVTGSFTVDAATGTAGQVLTSSGSAVTPTWTSLGNMSTQNANSVSITGGVIQTTGALNVTGLLTMNGATGTSGQVLTSSGSGATPSYTTLGTAATTASSAYATAAQGAKADSSLQNIVEDTSPQLGANLDTQSFTVDGRDVSTDGTKLDGIESGSTATRKNLVINGDLAINQRSVSGTVSLGAGAYGHDRFKAGAAGATYTFATTANVTTITITGGELQQVVSGLNIQSGTHTLSWTGTAQGKIDGGSYSASGVTGTLTGGTNATLAFNAGTLTKIKLEEGSNATAFKHISHPEQLVLCQHYYEKSYSLGTAPGTNTPLGAVTLNGQSGTINGYMAGSRPFVVAKRTTPTIVIYSVNGAVGTVSDGNTANYKAGTAFFAGTASFSLQNNSGSTYTPASNLIYFHFTADAEL